jgi:hypothetical protein
MSMSMLYSMSISTLDVKCRSQCQFCMFVSMLLSMSSLMLLVNIYASCPCPCPCLLSVSVSMPYVCCLSVFMLQCPCPWCMSMSLPMSMLHTHVHAAHPCPCCMYISVLYIQYRKIEAAVCHCEFSSLTCTHKESASKLLAVFKFCLYPIHLYVVFEVSRFFVCFLM